MSISIIDWIDEEELDKPYPAWFKPPWRPTEEELAEVDVSCLRGGGFSYERLWDVQLNVGAIPADVEQVDVVPVGDTGDISV
jgi:hypothetical protein